MIKILAAAALAVMILSPAMVSAAVTLMGSVNPSPVRGARSLASALPVRVEVDPPDDGPIIIECGPGATRTGVKTRVLSAALAGRGGQRPCSLPEREALRDQY